MQNLDQRTYDLLFDIQRSVRYHTHRRAFYEAWNRATSFIALVGASSALHLVLSSNNTWAGAMVMALIGLVAALDVLIGTAHRANEHTSLAQQFIALEQRFAHGKSLDDATYEKVVNRRLEIEAAEPPVKRLLDFLCDLEVRRAHNNQVQNPSIPWWRRITAQWFSQIEFAKSLHPGEVSA